MSYTALYRKFRPKKFEEIVGQDAIINTLKNQILLNRVGHAYLFNGVRGTGKTSAAKILARAINCLSPIEGEPCNECEICKGAVIGSLTDIVEMDAASNNSVEDIRNIREEVNFLPTICKYRVYIIDEVHMLSSGAFNALLKTLEEPPEHVKFILATTEPQKLPATILSRCQRFDFKRISNENIKNILEKICKDSDIEITKEALKVISVLSEGAMRDALSILERCIQDGEEKIDENKIKDLLGIPKFDSINIIAKNIIEYNIEECIKNVDNILSDGKDITNFIWEIIKYIKDILVYKTSKISGLYNEDEVSQMKELSEKASKERLVNLICTLSEIENNMKWSSQKTILLQAGIIKLCNKEENINFEELLKRIEVLENKTKGTIIKTNNTNNEKKIEEINIKKTEEKRITNNSDVNINDFKRGNKEDQIKEVTKKDSNATDFWINLVNKFKKDGKIMLYTNLLNTNLVEINDMHVGIEFPKKLTSFGKSVLEKSENINEIKKQVSIYYGKEMQIKFLDKEDQQIENNHSNSIEDLTKNLEVEINIIDD